MIQSAARRMLIALACSALFAAVMSSISMAKARADEPPANLQRLEQELSRIAASSRAVVGVSLRHLESGLSLSMNGDVRFPMASTVKIPVAVHILSLVDQGKLKLDQMITLTEQDVYPDTWGPIHIYFRPGSVLTLRDLLTLMLVDSDNNATDILLRLTGGTAAVQARMRAIGLEHLRIDRPIMVLIANLAGASDVSQNNPMSPQSFHELISQQRAAKDDQARARYRMIENGDLRDTTTPTDMAELLSKIWNAEILTEDSSKLLLDIMARCITGDRRLRGMLPPGTRVWDKTGSLGFTTNDVGIIDLPDGAGHLVAAVFTKDSYEESREKREAVIAQIARAAYDYFLFTAPPRSIAAEP